MTIIYPLHTSYCAYTGKDTRFSNDLIPLHAGCSVLVSKVDLVRIFNTNPSVYTGKLADLVFGKEMLQQCYSSQKKDRLFELNPIRLQSLIIHVVQVFTRRGHFIDEETVRKFLRRKINRGYQKGRKGY